MPWEGDNPIAVTAEELGWYSYWNPDGAGKPEENYGWVTCEKDDPRAGLDLNRVYKECVWDPKLRKHVPAIQEA
jgi:hypothetical protein